MDNYQKITTSAKDNHTELKMEKETIDMNLYEHIVEIKESVARVETKVDAYANFDQRLQQVEKNQWKIMGLYSALLSVVAIVIFLITKIT